MTPLGSPWNAKSWRERKPIFLQPIKTTVKREGEETDGRIKDINVKTRGKRQFFIILDFFVTFPFVSSVNVFVRLLYSISSPPPLLSSPLRSSSISSLVPYSGRRVFWSLDPTPHTLLSNPPGVLLTDTQFSCFIAYDKTLPLISHYRPTLWKWALNPSAQYCS